MLLEEKKAIKENLMPLYNAYAEYKKLFEYYMTHKGLKGEDEIRARIEYLLKSKIKQRNEIETLEWVLGECYEKSIDKTVSGLRSDY